MTYKQYTQDYMKRGRVDEYLSTFKNKPDQIIHELELDLISRIASKYRLNGRYLDVACGFGRIACFASKFFHESSAIDASPHMIAMIKKNCPRVRSQRMDAERLTFRTGTFDFITTFRFIMNFESRVRLGILKEINRVLKPGGIFLCNIHLNKWSPRGISGQLRNMLQNISQPYMSYLEARRELEQAGFEVLDVYGIKVIPFYRNRILIDPKALFWIERFLGNVPLLKLLADGYLFVCKKGSS